MNTIKAFFVLLTMVCGSIAVVAQPVTFSVNTTIGCGNASFEGYDVTVDNCVLTLGCAHSFNSLTVINGGIVTHALGDTVGLQLTITTNASVDVTSRIDVNGQGYAAATGPGAGTGTLEDAGGAGYGGIGGSGGLINNPWVGGSAYGSTSAPTHLGSGGGQGANNGGGRGGGAIRLIINGTLTLTGSITANGNNGFTPSWSGGGGSGGSIYLTVGTITGAGAISSNGGNGGSWGGNGSGSGAGGRIAIYYTNTSYTGNILAHAGAGWTTTAHGGAGTIYLKQASSPNGSLFAENNNLVGKNTLVSGLATLDTVRSVKKATLSLQGVSSVNNLTADSAIVELNTPASASNVLVKSNATLTTIVGQTLQVTVSGNLTIDNGGTIFANGKGYLPGSGPGAGATESDGGGGGYGGYGGFGSGGQIAGGIGGYGSITAPIDFGSGGGQGLNFAGGNGGGAIRLIVTGSLQNNGLITSNGANGFTPSYSGGGGSGGSIYITAGPFSGNGSITANGGNGGTWGSGGSGGGSGGRIAVYSASNSFSGTFFSCGGEGWSGITLVRGGAGTIYQKLNSQPVGDLTIANCVGIGNLTPITFAAARSILLQRSFVDWTGALTCTTMTISDTSELRPIVQQSLNITTSGNLSILGGSKLTADGRGYPASTGPGAGGGPSDAGGGGYGGQGGNGCQGLSQPGGGTYGSQSNPSDFGSGGGQGLSNGGGAGGGVVRLNVAGNLLFIGQISANGQNGFTPSWSGGGGSGGSVFITATTLGGIGLITANGGNGGTWGGCGSGGGGGGRISLPACTDTAISENVQVNGGIGGAGAQQGQPGTISLTVNTTDCDNNSQYDVCEIAQNPNLDCNINGILDICESFTAPTITIYPDNTPQLHLQWPCVPTATSYQIYRSVTQPVLTIPANQIGTTANTSFIDNAALVDKYFYVVTATKP